MNTKKKYPTLSTIFSVIVLILLLYFFLHGDVYRFYASFLFLFYSWTHKIWVSVVMLGIFQTLIMLPLRAINLSRSLHIKDFREKIAKIKNEEDQYFVLKQNFKQGNRIALYYIVNFTIQLVSYFSIGRLFLIDFYNKPLNPNMLFSFVKYPTYPIKDLFFKIPYITPVKTTDLGMEVVLLAWGLVFLIQIVFKLLKKSFAKKQAQNSPQATVTKKIIGISDSLSIFIYIALYFLLRNFPIAWKPFIFSGDVSIPNRTLNTITALGTFITIIWLDVPKIRHKVNLARSQNIDEKIVFSTLKDLVKETLFSATIVGLGAFYITNHIPCAFELSIFTLEIISWISPLTLDRLILSSSASKKAISPTNLPSEKE